MSNILVRVVVDGLLKGKTYSWKYITCFSKQICENLILYFYNPMKVDKTVHTGNLIFIKY